MKSKLFYGIIPLVIVAGLLSETPKNKVVFLDVGQGDSILLQNGTRQVLIDGGPGMKVLERLAEEMPWFDHTIEVLILTHPQRDHMEGLLHVIGRYSVEAVILPKAQSSSRDFEVFVREIVDRHIPYRFAWAGQTLTAGDIRFNILGPMDTPEAHIAMAKEVNNASIMMRADFCPFDVHCLSFLLTGDAERIAENMLVRAVPAALLDVDVIKAGHHGSNTSTHERLVRVSSPRAAVISVGSNNTYGHPHEHVLNRLRDVPLWRTDEHGSISFIAYRGDWIVTTAR